MENYINAQNAKNYPAAKVNFVTSVEQRCLSRMKVRISKLLRDDIEQYTKLTGVDGWNVPIMKIGAYLDGYNKGLDVLDRIRAEIVELQKDYCEYGWAYDDVLDIIDKYMKESEET